MIVKIIFFETQKTEKLKMIVFGTKVILMDLIRILKPILFPWQKVLLLWLWEKLSWKEK